MRECTLGKKIKKVMRIFLIILTFGMISQCASSQKRTTLDLDREFRRIGYHRGLYVGYHDLSQHAQLIASQLKKQYYLLLFYDGEVKK